MWPYRLMLSFTDSVMREKQETSHDRTMVAQDTIFTLQGTLISFGFPIRKYFATEKTYNFTRKEKLYSGQ